MRRFFLFAILICISFFGRSVRAQTSPTPIAYGDILDGELNTATPEHLYQFKASQGDAISAAVLTTDANFSPLIVLVDGSQQSVLIVGSPITGGSRLRFIIPTTAAYVLRVAAASGSGHYRLNLALDNPTSTPSPFANKPLIAPLDNTVQGDLTDQVRFRLFTLSARAGDTLNTTISVNVQAGMYLYTDDFTEVSRAELGAPLNATFSKDGIYYLMVARAAAETKSGTFTLTRVQAAPPTAIAFGGTLHGTIAAGKATLTYTLTGAAGQTVLVRMRRDTGDLVPYTYLISTDSGQKLAEAVGTGGVATLSFALPASGNFAVAASRDGQENGASSGNFTLSVTAPGDSAPIPPTFQGYLPLKYGDKIAGELDNTTFAVPYYFTAEVGDTITATMIGDKTLDPYLVLQDANGNAIAEDDNSAGNMDAQITFPIKTAGYYALIATRAKIDKGTTHGKYTLELTASGSSAATAAATSVSASNVLIPGQTATAQIGAKVGMVYQFDAGATMAAVNLDVAPSTGLNVTIVLLDETSAQVAAVTGGSLRGVNLTHPGRYTVLVVRSGGPNDPANGTVAITLQGTAANTVPTVIVGKTSTANPTTAPAGTPSTQPAGKIAIFPISYNGIATGTITAGNFLNYFGFQGTAGDVITLKMTPGGGSQLECLLYLYTYENNQPRLIDAELGTPDLALNHFTLPNTGNYLIVASRVGLENGTSTGSYSLTLLKEN
jgi:hypothetical protein